MARQSRLLVLSTNPALIAAAEQAVQSMPNLSVAIATPDSRARLMEAAAILVDADMSSAAALDRITRLAHAAKGRLLVAAPAASAEDLRRLFRAGAADVLCGVVTCESLSSALREVLQAPAEQGAPTSGVVCVIQAGGGAGATTVALNLAACLAQGGGPRGSVARRTAMLDLDLQFGDADVALDLQPRSTIVDALRSRERVDPRFLESIMTEHASGLKLLAAPPSVIPLDALDAGFALSLAEHAASGFERTIIDLPAAITDWTLLLLRRADLIVLVTPPTVAGAVRAGRLLDSLKASGVDRPVLLVINKTPGVLEALDRPARIGRSLELKVDATLPLDPIVARAADRGHLATTAFPQSRFTKALLALAKAVDARLATAPAPVQLEAAE
jgi:pilus assembly protein CpaE